MMHKGFYDLDNAYLWLLVQLLTKPECFASPRGQMTREIRDVCVEISRVPDRPPVTPSADRNATMLKYYRKEKELYASGARHVSEFLRASKFWGQLGNPDGTLNSAYGHLVFHNRSIGDPAAEARRREEDGGLTGPGWMRTPWEWAMESLRADPYSRQAFVRFSLPSHQWPGNRDQTCTMHVQLTIRDYRLHATTVMRSQDIVKGFPYDVPWFGTLMDRAVEELRPAYPGLGKGTYGHVVHSMHLYERDLDLALEMTGLTQEDISNA